MQPLEFPKDRYCGNCFTLKPKATGKLIPLPHNPLRGIWVCKDCLEKRK